MNYADLLFVPSQIITRAKLWPNPCPGQIMQLTSETSFWKCRRSRHSCSPAWLDWAVVFLWSCPGFLVTSRLGNGLSRRHRRATNRHLWLPSSFPVLGAALGVGMGEGFREFDLFDASEFKRYWVLMLSC